LFLVRLLAGHAATKDNWTFWQWNFDCHLVGYGYNGCFLGHHPYGSANALVSGIRFPVGDNFKRALIKVPSDNLAVGDKEPYGNPPLWTSSLWWVSSCMDPAVAAHSVFPTYEGVEPKATSARPSFPSMTAIRRRARVRTSTRRPTRLMAAPGP
jgi:hypothetical protein